jgi:hypothetical protein
MSVAMPTLPSCLACNPVQTCWYALLPLCASMHINDMHTAAEPACCMKRCKAGLVYSGASLCTQRVNALHVCMQVLCGRACTAESWLQSRCFTATGEYSYSLCDVVPRHLRLRSDVAFKMMRNDR